MLIMKAPGLVWLCPVPTQQTQTLPSHPTLRQVGCSLLYPPQARFVTCTRGTHSSQVQITPSPLHHFTRQYLFVPSLNLSAMVSLTCRPIFSLWTWTMSFDKYWVNHGSGMSGQPQTWLHCLKSDPSLSCPPVTNTHTGTIIRTSCCLPVVKAGSRIIDV